VKLLVAVTAAAAVVVLPLVLAGCAPAPAPSPTTPKAGSAEVSARLDQIEQAVAGWRSAPDLATAHRFAETARNLVVGADGPYYGDANGDGTIDGAADHGLLPGSAGEPGLATAVSSECVVRDILGGSWEDPAGRWVTLDTAIAEWSPSNNTFPSLPSHPQRVIGWATLTLAASDLDVAHEYAGHAQLHVDVSRAALSGC
jgi:hypothetical protein